MEGCGNDFVNLIDPWGLATISLPSDPPSDEVCRKPDEAEEPAEADEAWDQPMGEGLNTWRSAYTGAMILLEPKSADDEARGNIRDYDERKRWVLNDIRSRLKEKAREALHRHLIRTGWNANLAAKIANEEAIERDTTYSGPSAYQIAGNVWSGVTSFTGHVVEFVPVLSLFDDASRAATGHGITGNKGDTSWGDLAMDSFSAFTLYGSLSRGIGLLDDVPLAAKGTVDLYRAVGVREYQSVMGSGKFLPGANSLEGRQFARTLEEALKYADTDPAKAAILKVTVPEDVLPAFDFSKAIDPQIFKNGVFTVQPGAQSELFHQSLIGPVIHAF